MFNKKPINKIDGIYNFININDDFIEDYEKKSIDKKDEVSIETKIMKNLCEMIIINPKNIIDIGCGNGYIINNIKSNNKVAVDISYNQLKSINKDILRVRCNVEEIPIDKKFDYIICTDVFEHVQKPDKLVSEIYRLLDDSGNFLFAVPWKQDLSVYETKEYKENYKKYKYVHLRSVDESTIEKYLLKYFSIIKETEIDVVKRFMTLKPYSIKFFHMKRKFK